MACRDGPTRSLSLSSAVSGASIVISNPLGVVLQNAVVQQIALPVHGGTPGHKPAEWYAKNDGAFLTERRTSCVGCMVLPVENRSKKNSTDPNI